MRAPKASASFLRALAHRIVERHAPKQARLIIVDYRRSLLGAITTEARAVQGCRVEPLGVMRYRANASPAFSRRYFRDGFKPATLAAAPIVAFDRKDLLHEQFLRELGVRQSPVPTHFLPSPMAIRLRWEVARGGHTPERSLDFVIENTTDGRWLPSSMP